jgi:hypothetical protein
MTSTEEYKDYIARLKRALDAFDNGDCAEDYTTILNERSRELVKAIHTELKVADSELVVIAVDEFTTALQEDFA